MDRFYWVKNDKTGENERCLTMVENVRLYDGPDKTTFDSGILNITNHRMIWKDTVQKDTRVLALDLSLVKDVETEGSGMFKSAKIIMRLLSCPQNKADGPKKSSQHNFIKLSFRSGGNESCCEILKSATEAKEWVKKTSKSQENPQKSSGVLRHVGIGGIERKMEEKYKQTDSSINEAFKDLDALMEKAKDMVQIADKFSTKLSEKQVSMTDDETVQFKSYLLSMGIDNPVTRETHGSGVKYHAELAKQLAEFLKEPIDMEDGVMTLSDVYCRYNRARGLELVSPDDLVQASRMFERLAIPLRLRCYDSGVLVIQSLTVSEEELISKTTGIIAQSGAMTAEELSRKLNLALTLAKERLMMAESIGKLCRDDSVEGLRFYLNRFLLDT